jgi:hypothetical protein
MFQEFIMAKASKTDRYVFPPNAFDILQGIIINHDNGRFMDVIVDKSCGKNFEKMSVWNEVTDLFNKVSVLHSWAMPD